MLNLDKWKLGCLDEIADIITPSVENRVWNMMLGDDLAFIVEAIIWCTLVECED